MMRDANPALEFSWRHQNAGMVIPAGQYKTNAWNFMNETAGILGSLEAGQQGQRLFLIVEVRLA
jgi:hypothetical protein